MHRLPWRKAQRSTRPLSLLVALLCALACTSICMSTFCLFGYARYGQVVGNSAFRVSGTDMRCFGAQKCGQVLRHASPEGMFVVAGSDTPFLGRTQVVFDIMNTVVHDPFWDAVPKFFGMSQTEFMLAQNETAWIAFESGEIDEVQLQATLFQDRRAFDLDGLKAALVEGYKLVDGMAELLHDLTAAGHKLHSFTNYPEWYALIEEKLGLEAKFGLQWTCVSCDTGMRRPEPAAYIHLLRRLGVGRKIGAPPVLFIDGLSKMDESVRRAGITTVQFKDATDLRQTLGDILGSRKTGTAPLEGWPQRVMRWAGPAPPDGWLSGVRQ